MKHSFLQNIKSEQGFVLLYALLVSSIVLTVGLSLSDIFYKQLVLASVGQSSQVAYYAADSFRECLHYGDSVQQVFGNAEVDPATQYTLTCGNPGVQLSIPSSYPATLQAVDYSYSYNDPGTNAVINVSACAQVKIEDNQDNTGFIFTISGFNVPCSQLGASSPRVVQRVITMQS